MDKIEPPATLEFHYAPFGDENPFEKITKHVWVIAQIRGNRPNDLKDLKRFVAGLKTQGVYPYPFWDTYSSREYINIAPERRIKEIHTYYAYKGNRRSIRGYSADYLASDIDQFCEMFNIPHPKQLWVNRHSGTGPEKLMPLQIMSAGDYGLRPWCARIDLDDLPPNGTPAVRLGPQGPHDDRLSS
jgi:hypothetical protein